MPPGVTDFSNPWDGTALGSQGPRYPGGGPALLPHTRPPGGGRQTSNRPLFATRFFTRRVAVARPMASRRGHCSVMGTHKANTDAGDMHPVSTPAHGARDMSRRIFLY